MMYVALLRGINVGGKNRVEMIRLKAVFEKLGHKDVRTYINSGNVVFECDDKAKDELIHQIEDGIESEFGFLVPVVVRSGQDITKLLKKIPKKWSNDSEQKTDVMFLWEHYDKKESLNLLSVNQAIEEVVYLSGAFVWHIDRKNATKSKVIRMVGTDLYRHITIRNINTVRKLNAMMS